MSARGSSRPANENGALIESAPFPTAKLIIYGIYCMTNHVSAQPADIFDTAPLTLAEMRARKLLAEDIEVRASFGINRETRLGLTVSNDLVARLRASVPREKAELACFYAGSYPDNRNAAGDFPSEMLCVVIEQDTDPLSLDEVELRIRRHGLRAVVYTSASYTPAETKWRAVFPLAKPTTVDAYHGYLEVCTAIFGPLPAECAKPTQLWYIGRTPVNAAHFEVRCIPGSFIDELAAMDLLPPGVPVERPSSANGSGKMTPEARQARATARDEFLADPKRMGEARHAIAWITDEGRRRREANGEPMFQQDVRSELTHLCWLLGLKDEARAMWHGVGVSRADADIDADFETDWARMDRYTMFFPAQIFAIAREYGWEGMPPNADGMEPVIAPPASGEAYTADDVCKADDATLKAIAARPEGEALAGAIERRQAVLEGSADAVIAWLRRQTADVVKAAWVAMTLPLVGDLKGSTAEQTVVAEVMRLTGSKRIETRNALQAAQTDAKAAAKAEAARVKAAADAERKARRAAGRAAAVGDRTLIRYDPTMPHECAVKAVDALLKQAPPSALVNFSGTVSRIGVAKVRTTINGERTFVEQTSVIQHTRASLVRLFEGYVVFEEPGSEKSGPVATKLPVAVSEQVVELTTPVDRDRQDVIAPTGIETLEGLVSHPVVLPDGKVLSRPGLTDGFYIHGEAIEGCRPYSRDEASAALVRLRESFGPGVAWASPADLDRGIAMLLTGLMRRGLDQAPAFLVSAAVQSSGKTSLVKWVHALLTGEDLAVTSMAGGGSTEEFGKAVFSDLLRNPATICLDNIPDGARLESSVLAAILTAATYTGRILGASVVVNVRTNVLIAATGNNLSLGRDELSRFLPIRLTEAGSEVKAARARDIVGKARAVRADVLRDAIGILAGVLTARPAIALDSRFPGWDESVRVGILWAGGSDVAAGFAENEDQSGDRTAERVVFEVLAAKFGNGWFLRRDMAAAIRSGSHADIIDALTDLNVDPDSDQALGRLLAKMEGRSFTVGERKVTLVRETGTRGGIPRFQMRRAARLEDADPFGS